MALRPGISFGPYEVVEPIGSGGMGEVWRATDTNLKRDVALKILPQAFVEDADRLARFQREAEILASLNHPNIAQVYGLERADGQTAIIMELVEGPTLEDRLRDGAIPAAEATEIAIQIALALEAAHARAVIHRDLKPANIKLRPDGVVKVLDFGIAKTSDPSRTSSGSASPPLTTPALTETGMILGTAAYMSPEQARGKPVDTRTDVWAFGSVLYEMLTGQPPFLGEDVTETVAAVLKSEPDWSAMPANMPPLLTVFIKQCLSKDPRDRVSNIADVRLALAGKYDDSELLDANARQSGQAAGESRSSRVSMVLLGLAIGLLGVALWNFAADMRDVELEPGDVEAAGPRNVELEFRQLTFENGDIGAARFVPDSQDIVYSASWEGAPYELYRTSANSTQSSRIAHIPDADLLAISRAGQLLISRARQSVDGWQPRGMLAEVNLTGGGTRDREDGVVSADYGPDGGIAAIVRLAGRRMQVEFPVGNVIHTSNEGQIISSVRVSPDGQQVCIPVGYGFLYVSEQGGPARLINEDGTDQLPRITGCAWSPDGTEIWFSYAPSRGTFSNIAATTPDGTRRRTLTVLASYARIYDVSPEGDILVALGDLRFSVYGASSLDGREWELSIFDATRIRHFNRAGTQLLLDSASQGAAEVGRLFMRSNGEESEAIPLGNWHAFALSPAGDFFVSLGEGPAPFLPGYPRQITFAPTGAGTPQTIGLPIQVVYSFVNQIGTPRWEVRNADFSVDGNRLLLPFGIDANGVERAYVHDLGDGSTKPVTPEGVTGPVVFAPDGSAVIYHQPDGLYVHSVDSGEDLRLPGDPEPGRLARWSNDGESVYVVEHIGTSATIYERNLATGARSPIRTIQVPNPAGVTRFDVWVSGDGSAYAYTLDRLTADLFLLRNAQWGNGGSR